MPNEEIVAYNAYRSFGITNNDKFLENSIAALLNQVTGSDHVLYTENYFYEEALVTMYFIYEAESRYGYLNALINSFLKNGDISNPPDYKELGSVFSEYVYFLAKERMEIVDISQTCDRDSVFDLCIKRTSEYTPLMNDSVDCLDPIEESTTILNGFTPSSHPFHKYMRVISNNLSTALCINNELENSLIHNLVITKWNALMSVARKYALDQ